MARSNIPHHPGGLQILPSKVMDGDMSYIFFTYLSMRSPDSVKLQEVRSGSGSPSFSSKDQRPSCSGVKSDCPIVVRMNSS